MLQRSDELDPANAPQFRPETRHPTPNRGDIIVTESVPISPAKYAALPYGTPHQDFDNNGLVLVWQGPIKASNNQIRVIRIYSTIDSDPQDWFNFAQEFSGDIADSPTFIRSYTTLRTDYAPLPNRSLFTGIFLLKVTARGSGYTAAPTVVFSGPGSDAAAIAIMSPDNTKVIGLELTAEGTGYTTAPTITFTGGGGTGAAAIAQVQPANAYLVKEKMSELQDPRLQSLFVKVQRIYEVLPGPWIPFTRYDDDLGPIQGVQRAVLWDDPPQAASSDVQMKTTYEARDGSAIVAMEKVETWGRDPYQKKFEIESTDPTPEKFRADVPTTTTSQVEPGRPKMPVLVPGELRRSSEEVNKFWRREGVTRREPPSYPRELADYELGGIQTHGSEFGGTLETKHRLHNKPQTVEEGFDIIASKVEALGRGLTWRRTTRLFSGGFGLGPYIELLTGGEGYVDDPAVIFAAGDAGSGAAGTASVTETPIAIGDIDSGGVFTQTFVSNGDANGVLNFIGKRYNAGVWRNPADAGDVVISAQSHPSYPVSQARLNGLADRSTATTDVTVVPQPGGGHFIMIDLGPGRTLKANKITIQLNTPSGIIMTTCRVYGFNKFGVAPTDIGSGIPLPATAGAWTNGNLNPAVGYRYFWIYGLDPKVSSTPEVWPILRIGEVELYGELTIVPTVELGYSYNGDANGAFYYLGARGGAGTWRNPHTAGDIQITAPYDELALGTFDSMVDREASNTYFVDRSHAEVWFDLGADRSLLLTTLTFRQRADYGSPMTQVAVQGSTDGVTWEESQQMTVSGVAGAWTKVDITAFTKYYRFFRLIIPVGKTFLAVGELELYGTLHLAPAGSPEADFSVTGVQITAQGTNYKAPPRVVFSGGGPGTGAAGTAVVEDGKVIRVDITAAGSGYTSAPDVAFSVGDGGSGATVDATVAGGVVTALNLLTGGGGYTSPPKVKIVSSTGSGAAGHAVLTGDVVTSIVLDGGGSGYARAPVVVLYPESDPEADAEIGFDIYAITLVAGGSDYSSPPAVSIDGDGDTPARAVAVLGFPLASVLVDNPGDGYTSDPTPVFAGDGTGAAGTAVRAFDIASTAVTAAGAGYLTEPVVQVAGGGGSDAQFQALIARALLRIDMAAAGSGYTSDPTVVITGDGTGAAAHVVRSFGIASIAVSAGGTGYTVAPTVAIPAPTGANGRQATAHAVLTAGAVSSIVIDDAGQGYLTAPTPTMTGGDGTGATIGAATLASGGAIDSVVIDTVGANFSEPPIISFTGGAGTDAAASAILDTSVAGGIAKVKILNAGKDYTAAPTLTILPGTSGGTGATATATLSTTGKIKSVTLTNLGSGYTSQPTVTFTGGAGSGASGKGILAPTGSVKSVSLIDPGDGFRAGATVSFNGGGGSGASATVAPSGCGKVTKVTLTKPGGPFTEPPDVIFVGGQSLLCPAASKTWRATNPMSSVRYGHTATLLDDGRVLIAGGFNASTRLATCEIFDPETDTWSATGSMNTAREAHAAVKLADGKVLVCNGVASGGDETEIYDPATGIWTPTGDMVSGDPLSNDTTAAVLLDDGRVLAVRGWREANFTQLFDPGTGTWAVTDPLPIDNGSEAVIYYWTRQSIVKLADGTVLAMFGSHDRSTDTNDANVAIFDPVTELWSETTITTRLRTNEAAILLDDDRVFVQGGFSYFNSFTLPPDNQIYDPAGATWSNTVKLTDKRFGATVSKLLDGKVLVVGGAVLGGASYDDLTEVYDPVAGTMTAAANMLTGRRFHTQTTLPDGRVLVTGGLTGSSVPILTAEIYGPDPAPATAAYRLGSSWPTLREEQTDPTEKIIILIDKTIVRPETPLPAGFSDKFPLDIYRSIQIISKVNLRSLPPPDIWDTTQHIQLPQLLLSVYPIWDTNRSQATAGGAATGTQRGSVSASVQVIGSIVVTKLDGFRGAANATAERQFFFGPPPRELVPQPTIIRPSTGTAITVTTRNSFSRSGLTYSPSGNSNPAGNDFASYAKSAGSSGATTQVVDLHDVLTAGIQSKSQFNAANASYADALNVQVGAIGTFQVDLPASTPFAILPGQSILAQVAVEKWRFNLYVRTLIRVTVPALP